MVRLETTIPALPVRHVAEAAPFYEDRLVFRIGHQDDGVAVVGRDGNLSSFFEWVKR